VACREPVQSSGAPPRFVALRHYVTGAIVFVTRGAVATLVASRYIK